MAKAPHGHRRETAEPPAPPGTARADPPTGGEAARPGSDEPALPRAGPKPVGAARRDKAADGASAPGKGKRDGRRPPAKTFLVAATVPDGGEPVKLQVYAAVARGPGEALAAVKAKLGAGATIGLTGKLSGRMARSLGLKTGEVRRI